eukprot:TRINITY_DN80371_c0_g1_i1.p1 TRINITY_DN80371_c0_g1~~TRINITY_DN80371_c0_g1_i1.p1  ORF type:complete len:466 (+),score=81.97 TRINITY_DN80371_c0_g1_i1:118-1515(+)
MATDIVYADAGGAVLLVSSLDPACPAESVIDGSDSSSFWISTGLYPQELLFRLGRRCKVSRIRLLCTKIRQVRIEGCWEERPVNFSMLAERELADSHEGRLQEEDVSCRSQPGPCGYLRLQILSGWGDFCSIHRLQVQYAVDDGKGGQTLCGLAPAPGVDMAQSLVSGASGYTMLTPSCAHIPDEADQTCGSLSLSRTLIDAASDSSQSDNNERLPAPDSDAAKAALRVKVLVNGVPSDATVMEAREGWTVKELKQAIAMQLEIPQKEQKILKDGVPLADHEDLQALVASSTGEQEPVPVLQVVVVRCGEKEAMWISQLKHDGLLLRFVRDIENPHHATLAAVSQNGDALQFAGDEMRSCREVVFAAIRQKASAVQWATEELRADREVALATVSQNGTALEFVSEGLRGDREIVLAAVRQKGSALRYVPKRALRADPEVLQAATATYYFSQEELEELMEEDEEDD